MIIFSKPFEEALLSINRLEAAKIIAAASHQMAPLEIVDSVIAKALDSIGESWDKGDIALAQVYMSGRICEELVDRLLPPGDPRRTDQPPMAIAVLDDYHMLGKRIVYSVMRAAGFELRDYGRVTVAEAIARARADGLRLLLISTLMLHSALHVRDLVDGLKAERLDVRVVVGGAPFIFDPQLWLEVGADAMGRNAAEAAEIVRNALEGIS